MTSIASLTQDSVISVNDSTHGYHSVMAQLPPPGWYPQPPTGQQRYWDGYAWAPPPAPKRMPGWQKALIIAVVGFVSLVGLLSIWGTIEERRSVADSHSDDPVVEAFYRKLEDSGFGAMRSGDAKDWAQEGGCGRNPLVLWGKEDYSMADSFRFSTAALGVCDAL